MPVKLMIDTRKTVDQTGILLRMKVWVYFSCPGYNRYQVHFCAKPASSSTVPLKLTHSSKPDVNPATHLHLPFQTNPYMYAAKAPARRRANAAGMSYPFTAPEDGTLEEPEDVVEPPPYP